MTVNACGPRSATPWVDLTLHLTTMIRIRLPRGEWSFDESRPLGRPGGFGEVFRAPGFFRSAESPEFAMSGIGGRYLQSLYAGGIYRFHCGTSVVAGDDQG